MKTELLITFATEDAATPEHDQAIIRLANFLRSRGITAGFHLTGDYMRHLLNERKTAVIAALYPHEIGFHSNTHGCYPFLGVVCEQNSWDRAVEIIMHTESCGLQLIPELFDRPAAYVVSEFCKAPQVIDAYRRLGIKVNGLRKLPGQVPMVNYVDTICYRGALLGLEGGEKTGQLELFQMRFRQLYDQQEPTIKIFLHPYKLVYDNNLEAWHDINSFYRNYNPLRPWVAPQKSLYDASAREKKFRDFEKFIDYTLTFDHVVYSTTTTLAHKYAIVTPKWIPRKQFEALWQEFLQTTDQVAQFSPAEIIALQAFASEYPQAEMLPVRRVIGPEHPLEVDESCSFREVNQFIDHHQRMPDRLPPGLLPCRLPKVANGLEFQETIWRRKVFPDNFTGENLCRSALLQSWSFKALPQIQ